MESAKKQKSFPDLPNFSAESGGVFQLPSFFWDAVEKDPAIAVEFNRRVEARARQILEQEGSEAWKSLQASVSAEGIDRGVAEGRERVDKACAALETIAQKFLADRERLMHRHEGIWCEAIRYLSSRFLIPLTADRLKELQAWIEQGIGSVENQTTIQVAVSPKVFESLQSFSAPGWSWVADPQLKDGDLRVDLDGGGLHFSAEEEVERLRKKIDQVLGSA